MEKEHKIKQEWESVRLRKEVVDAVRENKKKTGCSVSRFFEDAALARLKNGAKEV